MILAGFNAFRNCRGHLNKVCDKLFFSSFFVSTTIIVAQIFFGGGAIKQKKKNPSVLAINGGQYKLSGFVLGAIVYYNCAVIYVIIAVSISFFMKYLGHLKHACQSSADCYYLNDSSLVLSQYI